MSLQHDRCAQEKPMALLVGAVLLLLAAPAFAGRPLNVDDAAILAAGDCQLEAFVKPLRHSMETSLQPACNVDGALEWAIPLLHIKPDHEKARLLTGVQAKAAF